MQNLPKTKTAEWHLTYRSAYWDGTEDEGQIPLTTYKFETEREAFYAFGQAVGAFDHFECNADRGGLTVIQPNADEWQAARDEKMEDGTWQFLPILRLVRRT